MKVSKAIEYLQALNPDEEIIIEWITKEYADNNEWGCEYLEDNMDYQEVPKEVWNELVTIVQERLEWEEMGNSFADWIHDQFTSLMDNKQKEKEEVNA